jgi:hypothetical protein
MPVHAQWRHQGCDAVDQFQRCEMQFVHPGTAFVTAWLTLLFGAAVDQLSALFVKTIHGKAWSGAIAQEPIQGCAVVLLNAHTSIHREAAVLVGQHVFGITTLQQASADEDAQDASAQIGLYPGHSGLIDSTGWVKDDARW